MNTETQKQKEFKDFKAALSLCPYNEFYFKSVLSHIDKITIGRKIPLNLYYDNLNQKTDRAKFHVALTYIESADLLPGKRIIFIERDMDKCEFFIDTKLTMKISEVKGDGPF